MLPDSDAQGLYQYVGSLTRPVTFLLWKPETLIAAVPPDSDAVNIVRIRQFPDPPGNDT